MTKEITSADVVNKDLVSAFNSALNFEAELSAFEKANSMLATGALSVRGLKVTIEAVDGALPTLRASHAQYFALTQEVRTKLSGAKDKPLRDVLNATIQAKRAKREVVNEKTGKVSSVSMFSELLEGSKTFAEFVKKTPKQGEKAKAEKATLADFKAVLATADGTLALALRNLRELEGEEALIKDVATAKALISVIQTGIANSTHPAIRAKVSA